MYPQHYFSSAVRGRHCICCLGLLAGEAPAALDRGPLRRVQLFLVGGRVDLVSLVQFLADRKQGAIDCHVEESEIWLLSVFVSAIM